ncbi:hypothetical protein SRABI123_02734 [Pseudomonas sp. Bi123]|nr:hypothetical protein SRABI123_02734 [Pseudomonas sp. Bi123]
MLAVGHPCFVMSFILFCVGLLFQFAVVALRMIMKKFAYSIFHCRKIVGRGDEVKM